MAFDHVVSLDLEDRPCVVAGGGPLAVERVTSLLASRARVTLITPDPHPDALAPGVAHVARLAEPDDLDGTFLAVVTREDAADVPALWAAAERRGVLFAALDDVAHCHFGAVSAVRRDPVTITISTAGRAPALSKRLRRLIEQRLGPEVGRLADLLHEARDRALPRPVPFDEWARRWEDALDDVDALLALVADGRDEEVVAHVLDHVRPGLRGPVAAARRDAAVAS